jgi:hypothetical protein
MDLLEIPIYVQDDGPVNLMDASWHRSWLNERDKERAYREFLSRRFPGDVPLDIIPLTIAALTQYLGRCAICPRRIFLTRVAW